MQALSLDIKVWGDNKEQIVIREFEEDDVKPQRVPGLRKEGAELAGDLDDVDVDSLSLSMDDLALADELDDTDTPAKPSRKSALIDEEDDDNQDSDDLDDDLQLDFDDDDIEIE